METVPKHLVARLLYTNPVCFLSTATETGRNVMTISWLTALSNHVGVGRARGVVVCREGRGGC